MNFITSPLFLLKPLFFFRLDAIARDAELQEKSEADLKRVAELLKERCEQAMTEYKEKLDEDPNFEGKDQYPCFHVVVIRL